MWPRFGLGGVTQLIIGKERRRLFRVVAATIVELSRRGIGVAGGALHVLQASAVVERGGDKRGPHRVGRETTDEADGGRILPQNAVDGVRGQVPAGTVLPAVGAHWPEQRTARFCEQL